MSLCDRLAAYFTDRPNQWVNGYELMRVGGSFAFRTRCSELRRPPFNMTIENKVVRHSREGGGTMKHWSETFYRYVKHEPARDLLEIAEREQAHG